MKGEIRDTLLAMLADALSAPVPRLTRREIRLPKVAGKAMAVIGMRRSGKSCFLWQCLGDLLAAGVEIRRFRDGLLHTKSIVVDEEITLFGTVNLDIRSFELNFEVSLIAYDRKFSAEVRALQRAYEERSAPLLADQWRARPRLRRLLENAVQTMSPLL